MGTLLKNIENGTPDGVRLHMKGASEIILGFCDKIHYWETNEVVELTPEIRAGIEEAIKTMAKASLRTISCAYKEI